MGHPDEEEEEFLHLEKNRYAWFYGPIITFALAILSLITWWIDGDNRFNEDVVPLLITGNSALITGMWLEYKRACRALGIEEE